ncbi:MAG: M48 family metalloprotease [Candidatus Solibacter usitatus]|nr:M48 family metalloprotease [Candidatus Solibacter usitatus]
MNPATFLLTLAVAAICWNLASIGIGLWLSSQARRAALPERPSVWFRYLRVSGWLLPLCALSWVALYIHLIGRVDLHELFETNSDRVLAFTLVLLAAPPLLAWLAFMVASRPVPRILRGVEWRVGDVAAQWLWFLVSLLLPFGLAMIGFFLTRDHKFRSAVTFFAIAALLFFLTANRRDASYGVHCRPLDSGQLRDRIFELAAKARTPLKRVMIIHASNGSVMNAAAASASTILLAEDLVRSMPRAELDAVVAHELGHLRHRHVPLVLLSNIVPIVLFGWLASLAPVPFIALNHILVALPPAILVGGFLSRRIEHAADKAASSTVEDPEVAIRMLARLTKLNLLPARWTGWDVTVMSHPSLEQRAAEIASQFSIPQPRVLELLRVDDAPFEPYSLPPDHLDSAWTAHKQRTSVRNLAIYLACLALPSAAASRLAVSMPVIPIWIAAAALTFCMVLLIPSLVRRWEMPALGRRIRGRLGEAGGSLVALRPTSESRYYGGYPYWDLGVVTFNGSILRYAGEEMSFLLHSSATRAVALTRAAPGWLQSEAVCFDTSYGTFVLSPVGATRTAALLDAAGSWLRAPVGEPAPAVSPLAFPTISSVCPKQAVLNGNMFVVMLLAGLTSLAASALVSGELSWLPPLVAMGAMAAELAPLVTYRETAMPAASKAP